MIHIQHKEAHLDTVLFVEYECRENVVSLWDSCAVA
jgi:hypothetical protein